MPHFVKIGQVIYTETKRGNRLDLPIFPQKGEWADTGCKVRHRECLFYRCPERGVVTRCADGCKLVVR